VLGRRYPIVVLVAAVSIFGGCVSVAPPAQTSAPTQSQPTAEPPGSVTAAVTDSPPTVEPPLTTEPTTTAVAVTDSPPTVEPSVAPEPTTTLPPTTTQPPARQDRPNLVLSDFVVEEDPVLAGGTATLTATVANTGAANAGPFIVEIVLAPQGQPELILDSKPQEALAVGASTTLTTSITPNAPGGMRFVARAHFLDRETEENASDNERVLELTVASAGNLAFAPDGFTVAYANDPGAPDRYFFNTSIVNTGPSALVGTIEVRYFGYSNTGDLVRWGYADFDVNLAAGDAFNEVAAFSVDPGSYRAYALADSQDAFQETNEDDNEAFVDFVAAQ